MPRRSAKPRRLPNTQRIGASRANAGEGKKSSCLSHLCETPQPCGEPTRPLAPARRAERSRAGYFFLPRARRLVVFRVHTSRRLASGSHSVCAVERRRRASLRRRIRARAPSAGVGHDRRTGEAWTPSPRTAETGRGPAPSRTRPLAPDRRFPSRQGGRRVECVYGQHC